jgi:hypothetical protein
MYRYLRGILSESARIPRSYRPTGKVQYQHGLSTYTVVYYKCCFLAHYPAHFLQDFILSVFVCLTKYIIRNLRPGVKIAWHPVFFVAISQPLRSIRRGDIEKSPKFTIPIYKYKQTLKELFITLIRSPLKRSIQVHNFVRQHFLVIVFINLRWKYPSLYMESIFRRRRTHIT